MELTDIFKALGETGFGDLMRTISIGRLKTYKLYEPMKARAHLPKLNVQGLKKVTPRFWERINDGDEDLAADLAQAVLVGNFEMMIDVLDWLGIPHQDGFFDKDMEAGDQLKDDWQQKAFEQFREKYPRSQLLFYLNHLSWEITKDKNLFTPAGAD